MTMVLFYTFAFYKNILALLIKLLFLLKKVSFLPSSFLTISIKTSNLLPFIVECIWVIFLDLVLKIFTVVGARLVNCWISLLDQSKHTRQTSLQMYMKFWRSRLARLNNMFDTYIKENHQQVDYHVKTPSLWESNLT